MNCIGFTLLFWSELFLKIDFLIFVVTTQISCGRGSTAATDNDSPRIANAGLALGAIDGATVLFDVGAALVVKVTH